MAAITISGVDDTQYGHAVNGMTYRGQTVGSGYDCAVKRESVGTAIVSLVAVGRDGDWLSEQVVDPDEDLQALAVRIASQGPGYFGCGAATPGDYDWDDLAERWYAITVDWA